MRSLQLSCISEARGIRLVIHTDGVGTVLDGEEATMFVRYYDQYHHHSPFFQELGIFSLGFGSMAIKMAHPCSSSTSLGMKSSKFAGKGWADLPRGRESLWEEKDKDPEPFLLMSASKYLEWFGVVTKRIGTSP